MYTVVPENHVALCAKNVLLLTLDVRCNARESCCAMCNVLLLTLDVHCNA